MHFGPTERWTRTLRFQLMLWNAFVVVLTGLVTLIGLREGVRYTLIRELDDLLREDLAEIRLALGEFGNARSNELREQLDRKTQGHSQHEWFAHLTDERGAVVYSSATAPGEAILKLAPMNQASTIGNWRIVSEMGKSPSLVTVRLGASLRSIGNDVGRIDRLVGVAGGIILLIAPACGYWLAGRATRPLRRIMNTMAKLRPSRLDERLAIRGTGDELDQLANTFNRLLDRIGEYLQAKSDFLANAAHELRTPLAAIRSSVEVTLAGDRTAEEYEELLRGILEESESLELLVNQLLLLAETDAEKLKDHYQPVELGELLAKALDMFRGVAESRDIDLDVSLGAGAVVHGNAQHLRQVIYNLVDNAIKFTPPKGKVRAVLSVDRTERQVTVRISDSGAGISPEDLKHVFDRFFRGDRARRRQVETRGTGLGLSICRAIVDAHGGQIRLESELGKGTLAVVTLPLASAEVSHGVQPLSPFAPRK